MQTRPRIALTVIARDEEDNLADLAASVSGQVDEMVLLDTGSVDGTVERARELGFIVGHRPWTDSFAEARNAAWELTDASWLLTLDCDERLVVEPNSPTLHQIVAQAQAAGASGCTITCMNYYSVDQQSQALTMRLHRREGQHWVGRVHERVLNKSGGPVPHIIVNTVHIVHHGYLPEVMEAKGKAQRNLHLAQQMYDQDADVPIARRAAELARALVLAGGDPRDIAYYCNQALKDPASLTEIVLAWVLDYRTKTLVSEGNLREALDILLRPSTPRCALLSMKTSGIALTLGMNEISEKYLRQSYAWPAVLAVDPSSFSLERELLSVQVMSARGDVVAALDLLIEISNQHPQSPRVAEVAAKILNQA